MIAIILLLAKMSYQDIKSGIVDDELQLFLISAMIILDLAPFLKLSCLLYIICIVFYRFFKKYIGGADVKLIIILLAFYGPLIVYVTFFASLIGLFVAMILKKRQIRFIPFICLGVFVVEFCKFIF